MLSDISKGKEEPDKNLSVKSARNHHIQQTKSIKTPQNKNSEGISSKLR